MRRLEYYAPRSLDEALVKLDQAAGRAQIIAGGTDLLPRIRLGIKDPELLIDLRLVGLNGVWREDDYICLGAHVTHSQVIETQFLSQHFPALVSACRLIGGPSIRNRGTLGGNLVSASPAADAVPPLLIYNADLLLVSGSGERWLPIDEFFIGHGQTDLARAEILKEIRLPLPSPGTAATFAKLGNRQAMAIAVVSVAVGLTLGEAGHAKARIALGSVASRPIRAKDAEEVLNAMALTEELIAQAATVAASEASPMTDVRASSDYRRRMVEVLVRRALIAAWKELRTE